MLRGRAPARSRPHLEVRKVPLPLREISQAQVAALPVRWRYRLAPAMAKEFFKAHFVPQEHGLMLRIVISAAYYLAALLFNAFPLPQRETGARQTLRYMGDLVEGGFSILIFPEGHRSDTGAIDRFRPGICMIASRLDVAVVPVRLEGVDLVLHRTWHMARPGRVRVAFGTPMGLTGGDYGVLVKQVENPVRRL